MWYQKTAEETEKYFGTDRELGLTEWEHERRLENNGLNRLEKKKKYSAVKIFLKQFTDFMVMILLAAAIISAAMGETADAVMIVAILIMNSVLGFVQEYKAERSLESLQKMTEDEARVFIGGELCVKKAEELVVGDVVLLESGTKVPADIRVTESSHLRAEESILTGESEDTPKSAEALTSERPLSERSNMCYSGTIITGGHGRGIVVDVGMGTELGQIAKMLDSGKTELTPLQKQLKHLGKILILLCVLVCAVVSAAGFVIGGDLYTMILTGVSLGVASIPEGLPIVVTVCLALGVRRLTAVNAIIRRLPAVETLGCVNCICTDKTGTLTKSRMETQYFYENQRWHPVDRFGETGALAELTNLVISNCSSLYREGDSFYGDSTEIALMLGAEKNGAPIVSLPKIDENAFDSDRKMMSVRCLYRGHTVSLVKGAPDRVLKRCRFLYGDEGNTPCGAAERNKLEAAAAEYGGKGYRILAMAMRWESETAAEMEKDLAFLSFAAIRDPLRDGVKESLKTAAEAGVRSIMITGDQRGTALAIGRELGLAQDESGVLTGDDLRGMSEKNLIRALRDVSVYSSVSPSDKMRIVSALRKDGAVCAMTGDGVNDAPALKEADIGIAMGQRGTDVTKEAADFILADDHFSSIVEAITQGRGIYENIRRFIRYLLSSNLGEVLLMVLSVLLCFPLPLLPLQILWMNLVTDGLPALALALEPTDPSFMREKPRDAGESIFGGGLGRKILFRGFVIGILCFAVFLLGILRTGDMTAARTMAFNALVLSQLFYVFDCRGAKTLRSKLSFRSNPFLWVTVVVSFIVQGVVIYHPFFNGWFLTVPLALRDLGLSVLFAALPSLLSLWGSLFIQKKKEKF